LFLDAESSATRGGKSLLQVKQHGEFRLMLNTIDIHQCHGATQEQFLISGAFIFQIVETSRQNVRAGMLPAQISRQCIAILFSHCETGAFGLGRDLL
jgi:hypothetical protein